MITKKEVEQIVLREKETRLNKNRVPRGTRKEFIDFANKEFEDDYGMTLKYVWDNFKLWKVFFENMDMKLDKIISLAENQNNQKSEEKEVTLCSGKKIKLKGGKE